MWNNENAETTLLNNNNKSYCPASDYVIRNTMVTRHYDDTQA